MRYVKDIVKMALAGTAYILFAMLVTEALGSPVPTFWSDSYDAGDGICRCDSTYDHGLATMTWPTPQGPKLIPQICSDILAQYGVGPTGNRTYYNTIQCGHEPRNTAADEAICPGVPDPVVFYSGPRCQETGALWPIDALYPVEEPDPVLTCGQSNWASFASFFSSDGCATSDLAEHKRSWGVIAIFYLIASAMITLIVCQILSKGNSLNEY